MATTPSRSATAEAQPLGQILRAAGRLSPDDLERALARQEREPRLLGELLCEAGAIDGDALREALMRQAGVEMVSLERLAPEPEAVACLAGDVALRRRVLPLAMSDHTLKLAMADPFDHAAAADARVLTGRRIERLYCPEAELIEAVRKAYGSKVARMIADLDGEAGRKREEPSGAEADPAVDLQELAREPSIVNLVNLILLEAVEARASDVHVEPFERKLKVKYRIDGVLHEVAPPPPHLYAAIASRIKIMGGMNIAERFVPQDGHFAFTTPRGKVDIRVATVPTIFGESVVMRVLDRSVALVDLDGLGLSERCLGPFAGLLARPHGIVLVTGPTGSGKTTTLYAALNHIYTPERKIITIEDPVEYELEGVNQIPVNRKRGLDFAGGLRAILRQDPDVIMVGEVRDRETADIAIRSALTGHLVFSTLHTNDAAGAVSRLLDMGVEPFLLASSLEGVLAQRLVRRVCHHCRRRADPPPQLLERLGHRRDDLRGAAFYEGAGCAQCRQSGYRGRTGIFELLRVSDRVREVILRRGSAAEVLAGAPAEHQPMREDGYQRALAGDTTLEEVLRVTQDTPTEEALTTD